MRILYEDRSLIAVYKEPGLAVQTKKVTEKDLPGGGRRNDPV